jgi:signal transduction histidine kinase
MDLRGMAADPSAERLLEVFASRAGAELQRLRAERALARAAEERTRLEEQMRHAQKLESMGVLAGGIAHDFNNLLVGMLGNAGLALADLPEGLPGRRYVEEIASSARRAAELANQMLAYSGKGRFVVRTVDLNELVADMVHLLEASVSKKAELRVALASRAPCVEADATQLRQVVMNLITNASDALGEASGTITVATGEVDVSRARLAGAYIDEGLPAGRYVFLRVEDTGCGMDEATRGRIFDPFFTTKFTGRGASASPPSWA